jgi:hypothetical protein
MMQISYKIDHVDSLNDSLVIVYTATIDNKEYKRSATAGPVNGVSAAELAETYCPKEYFKRIQDNANQLNSYLNLSGKITI